MLLQLTEFEPVDIVMALVASVWILAHFDYVPDVLVDLGQEISLGIAARTNGLCNGDGALFP